MINNQMLKFIKYIAINYIHNIFNYNYIIVKYIN